MTEYRSSSHLIEKRKERKRNTAEYFTPDSLVQEMLDKLPIEVWTDPTKTFLDNSAGNGNFIIAIIKRKLQYTDPLQALNSTFAVELMEDNVEEMKHRILELIPISLHNKAKKIIDKNIVCHDALTWDYENWKSPIEIKPKPLF